VVVKSGDLFTHLAAPRGTSGVNCLLTCQRLQ
jgi:hypothetical protein